MVSVWEPKDPDEVLDYGLDWSGRLASGDTIATSTWVFVLGDDELILETESHDDTTTTVWLLGGTLQQSYKLTNRIETIGGRTHDQTVSISVLAK